jgi:hypothetical protein
MVSECPKCASGDKMALDVEEIVNGAVGGEKLLGCALRLEALHLPLSSSDRNM